MKKTQGENPSFIEFLKTKSELDFGETLIEEEKVLSLDEKQKEIVNLSEVLDGKIEDIKLKDFDVEETLVVENQKIINGVKFEFFRDLGARIKNTENKQIFGKALTSKYLVPSLVVSCACLILFSAFVSISKVDSASSRLSSSSAYRGSIDKSELTREDVQAFILENVDGEKGRVAGATDGIAKSLPKLPSPPSSPPEEPKSGFMKALGSLAAKQVELSNLLDNKLLKILNKD